MSYKLIKKSDFYKYLEDNNFNVNTPNRTHEKSQVIIENVTYEIQYYFLKVINGKFYFCQKHEADIIRIPDYWGNTFSLKGKGSRSNSAWEYAKLMQEEINLISVK